MDNPFPSLISNNKYRFLTLHCQELWLYLNELIDYRWILKIKKQTHPDPPLTGRELRKNKEIKIFNIAPCQGGMGVCQNKNNICLIKKYSLLFYYQLSTMKIEKFEDLIAWQKAKELTTKLYDACKNCKEYGLKDIMTKTGIHMMNDIAEGFEKRNNKDIKAAFLTAK
jgi:hypothetical protein